MKGNAKCILNRLTFLIVFAVLWEFIYRIKVFNPLLFPSMIAVFKSLILGISEQGLLLKTLNTLSLVFEGLLYGLLVAFILFALSMTNKFLKNIVDSMVMFFQPIPGIAILPLCILWFGIDRKAIIFMMIHSITWSVLTNMSTGRDAILPTFKEIGYNLELSKFKLLKDIYLPACMPYITSALKIGLSRAWRTAISGELLAGMANAGLGRQMAMQRNSLDMSGLLSSVVVIAVVGILLDILISYLEHKTVERWGMKK